MLLQLPFYSRASGENWRYELRDAIGLGMGPVLWVLALLAGCQDATQGNGFDQYFVEVDRVELQEFVDDPIVAVDQVVRRPGGGFALADRGSGRVRLFDSAGRQEEVLGRRGEGPGEFESPTAAVELSGGEVVVAEGAAPRLTIFGPDRAVWVGAVPGQYAFWLEPLGRNIAVGLGSRDDRFAVLTPGGNTLSRFGAVDPEVNEIPFWIFFARDRAAVIGEHVAVNTSFYPTVRIFDAEGDSVGMIGTPPPSWIAPDPPPIDELTDSADRERIAQWSRSFTVVRKLAAVSDTLLAVQYGSHDPTDGGPYYVEPQSLDVYGLDGRKLAEDVALPHPVVGGGRELMVLSAEPPSPWTISLYRWRDR